MRTVWTVLAVLIAAPALLLVVVVVLPDAELDPDAARWLAWEPAAPAGGNVFEAIVGLQAAPGEDPVAAGARMIDAVNAALAAGPGPLELDAAWTEPPLGVDASVRELCQPTAGPCLAEWSAASERVDALARGHAALLERYESLQAMPAYVDTLAPDHRAPLPPVLALVGAQRLWLARLGLRFDPADPAPTVSRLRADLDLARRMLSGAQTMVGKLAAAEMLAADLALYAELAGRAGRLDAFDDLAPLGQDATDLGACVTVEFRLAQSAIASLEAGEGNALGDEGAAKRLPKALLKPNRATNLLYRHFVVQAVHAGLPAPEYARVQRETGGATIEPRWLDYALDPIGTILFDVARADLSRYLFRLHDLAGMVTLVNTRLALLRDAVPPTQTAAYLEAHAERLHGPYDMRPLGHDPREHLVYFETPGPNKQLSRLAL